MNDDIIVKAVVTALKQTFDIPVYIDFSPQHFNSPCFFVYEIEVAPSREIGSRIKMTHRIEVTYYPDAHAPELRSFRARTLKALNKIDVETFDGRTLPLRSLKPRSRPDDNLVIVCLTYEYCLKEEHSAHAKMAKASFDIKRRTK